MEKVASLPIEEIFGNLNTSENGLTSEEAKLRLKKYGFNQLSEKRQIPFIRKFIRHLKDLFGILLIVAAILSYVSSPNDPELALIILAVVFVNIFVSIFQESRAEKAMETLKSWMPE